MLAKKFRLPSTVFFTHVPVFHCKEFLVKHKKNSLAYNRYGFIVSKGVDKKAVVRNRLKRQFRAVIEKEWLDAPGGQDILFVLKPSIKDVLPEVLQKQIQDAMGGIS